MNWKVSYCARLIDRYQDFMAWLVQHNFNDLNERIFQSEELQRDLSALLSQDLSIISSKLDSLTGSLSSVAEKIDCLAKFSQTLGADTEALSDQAAEIIKVFDQKQAIEMIFSSNFHCCIFDGMPLGCEDVRFMQADIVALEKLNFIRRIGSNNDGDPIYSITRSGSKFAAQLPEVPL